jgi:hypothetical protein
MKPTWNQVAKKVREKVLTSASWNSDQKHLLEVITVARRWKLDPASACKAGISNLRIILPSARKAIQMDNRTLLEQLFDWAAYMPTTQLRVEIGVTPREQIPFFQSQNPVPQYHVTLTADQFRRVKSSHRHRYTFAPVLYTES